MSTRCQIMFEHTRRWTEDGEENQQTERLLSYKHSDGYPSSVVPLLREYYRWNGRTNDFEYFTATWFYYNKRRQEYLRASGGYQSDETRETIEHERVPHMETGYGICANNRIHPDIDHFYAVNLSNRTIEHYTAPAGFNATPETPEKFRQREPEAVYRLDGHPETKDLAELEVAGTVSSATEFDTAMPGCEA